MRTRTTIERTTEDRGETVWVCTVQQEALGGPWPYNQTDAYFFFFVPLYYILVIRQRCQGKEEKRRGREGLGHLKFRHPWNLEPPIEKSLAKTFTILNPQEIYYKLNGAHNDRQHSIEMKL